MATDPSPDETIRIDLTTNFLIRVGYFPWLLRKHKYLLVSNQTAGLVMRIDALPKGTSASTWFRTRVTRLPDQGPVSQSLFTMTNEKKISDKSADNQSEARISVAYNKNCHLSPMTSFVKHPPVLYRLNYRHLVIDILLYCFRSKLRRLVTLWLPWWGPLRKKEE